MRRGTWTIVTILTAAGLGAATWHRAAAVEPQWTLASDSPVKPDASLMPHIAAALDAAAKAGTYVPFSQFNVRAATAFEHDGQLQVVTGGNTEYGLPQAIHGETSMVNHAIVRFGPDVARQKVRFVAFFSAACGTSTGCGDCRDYMRATTQYEQLLWVCGRASDRAVYVRRFTDGLRAEESFPDVSAGDVGITSADLKRLVDAARAARTHGVNLFTTSAQHTAAAALTSGGRIHAAAGADDAAFHYRYPIGGALQQAATAGEYAVRAVLVVAAEGEWPRITYRDRQYGVEYSSFGEKRGHPPIRLVLTDGRGRYKATTFEEALPNAFSVARFNPEAIERFLGAQPK